MYTRIIQIAVIAQFKKYFTQKSTVSPATPMLRNAAVYVLQYVVLIRIFESRRGEHKDGCMKQTGYRVVNRVVNGDYE